jgi:putative ABC transport system substrate-binding protein
MTRLANLTMAIIAAHLSLPLIAPTIEAKPLRVGDVSLGPITLPTRAAFLGRMAELGYEQGRNFSFEYIQVQNRAAFASAYRELVNRKVDILIAAGHEVGLKSALATAGNLPIVMVAIDYDPLARGYVRSLARSGSNVTGVFFQQITLTKKRLQIMKDAFPDAKAATVIWDWASADQWKVAQTAAVEIGFPVHGVEFRDRPYDYDSAFAQVANKYRGALLVPASPIWKFPARRIVPDFALRHRIQAMYFSSSYVRAGGLMSYGVSFPRLFRRAADYVDKIAKGAKPEDLPIEQPTEFELVVNLKTAKALGITFPPSILLRADKVIE